MFLWYLVSTRLNMGLTFMLLVQLILKVLVASSCPEFLQSVEIVVVQLMFFVSTFELHEW